MKLERPGGTLVRAGVEHGGHQQKGGAAHHCGAPAPPLTGLFREQLPTASVAPPLEFHRARRPVFRGEVLKHEWTGY